MSAEIVEIQKVLLDIYKEYYRICIDYNLSFFGIGGTCLGAIRHKGFIPWDDDMDIVMPYPDYKKFLEICKTELKDPYGLILSEKCPHCNYIFCKIQNKNTTSIDKFYEKYYDTYRGVNIDIFPFFGLPHNRIKRFILRKINTILIYLDYKIRFPIEDNKSIFGKMMWIGITPFRLFCNYSWATEMQKKIFEKYSIESSEKIIFPWRPIPKTSKNGVYQDVFFREDFSEYIKKDFENCNIRIPIGYDRYLRMEFDKYWELPNEKDRKPLHDKAILDLHKSYTNYLNN